jgi:hypothetical protein
MRFIASAAISALFAVSVANAQPAQPAFLQAAKSRPVCLEPYLIDHTHTVDPRTILFYMRGGKIWQNTLPGPCPELMFHGFAYVVRGEYICSNMQGIRVLRSGAVCELGAFTPYNAPPRASAS